MQRVCIKFRFNQGKTFTESFQMSLQAYGEHCSGRAHAQCHERYRRFRSGRTSNEDESKSGRHSTLTDDDPVEKVLAAIRQDPRLTVRDVAEEIGICNSPCHLVSTEKKKENGRCQE